MVVVQHLVDGHGLQDFRIFPTVVLEFLEQCFANFIVVFDEIQACTYPSPPRQQRQV